MPPWARDNEGIYARRFAHHVRGQPKRTARPNAEAGLPGFSGAGMGEPVIRFNFGDTQFSSSVSAVDRVLKRHPELKRFVTTAVHDATHSGSTADYQRSLFRRQPVKPCPSRRSTRLPPEFPDLFPFHDIAIHFHSPEFGELIPAGTRSPEMTCGILVGDSWWVNGRNRSLSARACSWRPTPPARNWPSPPAAVATVLSALGKARRTVQAPLLSTMSEATTGPVPGVRTPMGAMVASANPGSGASGSGYYGGLPCAAPGNCGAGRAAASSSGARRRGLSRCGSGRNRRTEEACAGACVQTHGLYLPRRIGIVHFAAAHGGESDGGATPGRGYLGPQGPCHVPCLGAGIQGTAFDSGIGKRNGRRAIPNW